MGGKCYEEAKLELEIEKEGDSMAERRGKGRSKKPSRAMGLDKQWLMDRNGRTEYLKQLWNETLLINRLIVSQSDPSITVMETGTHTVCMTDKSESNQTDGKIHGHILESTWWKIEARVANDKKKRQVWTLWMSKGSQGIVNENQ